jgi:alpha-ketoglutarate-dependent taurine dioxygenase
VSPSHPDFQLVAPELRNDRAWRRDTLSPSDWIVPVAAECLAEIARAVQRMRTGAAAAIEDLSPDEFQLPACARLMGEVRDKLGGGPGLAVVDRIPVRQYSTSEGKAIGWLLASLLGRIVAQKWDGTRLYDVKDSGQALGYGVRRSVTNLGQPFHTDGPWLWQPPAFVGLCCLETSLAGGESRVVSLVSAHNLMRARHPRLMPRLYAPFSWDRQAEHDPADVRWSRHPVFASDGDGLIARYYDDYIANGQRLAEEPLDAEGADALAALRDIVDAPEQWIEFRIEPGQLQYLNNRQLAHSRTAFRDSGEAGQVRHMLRLWNRDEGTLHIDGQAPA